jgi:hypothetical protein
MLRKILKAATLYLGAYSAYAGATNQPFVVSTTSHLPDNLFQPIPNNDCPDGVLQYAVTELAKLAPSDSALRHIEAAPYPMWVEETSNIGLYKTLTSTTTIQEDGQYKVSTLFVGKGSEDSNITGASYHSVDIGGGYTIEKGEEVNKKGSLKSYQEKTPTDKLRYDVAGSNGFFSCGTTVYKNKTSSAHNDLDPNARRGRGNKK